MTEQDKRELQWTEKRVEYNNTWPTVGIWHRDVQKALDGWLKENGLTQLFETVKLSDSAKDVLFQNPKLNKLVSGILDIYDELPYRPDEGVVIAWRSLEIFMRYHRKTAWASDDDNSVPHLITKTVNDLVSPLGKKDPRVKDMWVGYLADIPLSTLIYTINRCYVKHDLAINSEVEKVSSRAEGCLTNVLYDDIKNKYNFEQEVKPGVDALRRAAMLLQKILKGDEITVNGHKHQLGLEKRLEFVLSCMVYTYRCERFHGDYFSPFKSDRASLDTYAFSYYLLSFCYIYFWTLVYRHCELYSVGEICSLDGILDAAKTMQTKMKPLIITGKKG